MRLKYSRKKKVQALSFVKIYVWNKSVSIPIQRKHFQVVLIMACKYVCVREKSGQIFG